MIPAILGTFDIHFGYWPRAFMHKVLKLALLFLLLGVSDFFSFFVLFRHDFEFTFSEGNIYIYKMLTCPNLFHFLVTFGRTWLNLSILVCTCMNLSFIVCACLCLSVLVRPCIRRKVTNDQQCAFPVKPRYCHSFWFICLNFWPLCWKKIVTVFFLKEIVTAVLVLGLTCSSL